MIFVFFLQNHWSSAKFDIPAAAPFTQCEMEHGVIEGDIHTYVAKRSADRLFQKSQLPRLR